MLFSKSMSAEKNPMLSEHASVLGASGRELWLNATSAHDSLLDGTVRPSVRLVRVVGLNAAGLPLVDFPDNPESQPLAARHTCAVCRSDIGREAVVVFNNDDLSQPIVLGLLQSNPAEKPPEKAQPLDVIVEGKHVVLTAEDEIVLRCGKASITLTRAGKVLITGEYLLSRSNGVNRIKGGSVQIN